MHGLYLLSHPDLPVMDLLHYCNLQVTLGVPREVEMSPSGLHVSVNIAKVLLKSLFQALTGLADILLATPGSPTADGIDQVEGVAVSLSLQVNLVVGCCSFKG